MNLIPISRPIQIAMPGQVRFQPPDRTDEALYQGLSSFGDSVGSVLDDYFQQRALQATVPTVEEIRQYQQQQSPEEQPAEQTAATDQFVYGDDNAIPPPQSQVNLADRVPPPQVEDPLYAQGYRYRFNGEPMYNAPSQDAINMAQSQARADYYGGLGDTSREMSNRVLYERSKAQLIADTFRKAKEAGDLDAVLKLRNDIPDNLTYQMERMGDTGDQYAIYMTPTGKPDARQLVRQGTKEDLKAFVLQDISPEMAQQAAKLYADQKYQQEGRNLAWSTEARQIEAARRTALTQNLDLIEKQLDPKSGIILSEDQYKQLRGQQDAIREELLRLGPMGGGGLGAQGADLSGYKGLPTSRNALGWKPKIEEVVQSNGTGVDPLLVVAMLDVESSGNYKATSPKNAQGLMQLIPETAERFGVKDVWNPVDNINGGTKYLKFLLDRYNGRVDLALAAYNAGEGAVDEHGGIPPYAETKAYVPKVLGKYNALKQQFGNGAQPQATTAPQQVAAGPTIAPPQLENPKAEQYRKEYEERYKNPPVDKETQQKAVTAYFKQLYAINQNAEYSDDVKKRMVEELDATMAPWLPPTFRTTKDAKGTQADGPSDTLVGMAEPDKAKPGDKPAAEGKAKDEPLTLEQRAAAEAEKYAKQQADKGKVKEAKEKAMEQTRQNDAMKERLGELWKDREQLRNNPEKRQQALADLEKMDKVLPADRDQILRTYQYLQGQADWEKYKPKPEQKFQGILPTFMKAYQQPKWPGLVNVFGQTE